MKDSFDTVHKLMAATRRAADTHLTTYIETGDSFWTSL